MTDIGFTTSNLHSDRLGSDKLGVPEHGSLHKPVHHSVAFGYDDARDLAAVFQGKRPGFAYGRQSNPTVEALEIKVTRMEDGVGSVAFATGMAAIGSAFWALLRRGDHVVASSFLFGNTASLLTTLNQLGVDVDFVDATRAENVAAKINPSTRMVFVETVANPVTQIADLESIGNLCRENNIIYIVDNTMTSPYLFQPKTVGASFSVNSLTKYIGGHGNALGGSITDTGLFNWESYDRIYDTYKQGSPRSWALVQIRKKGLRDFGATMAPESAHILSAGSDTLALRMERNCANALQICRLLNDHPKVARVNYPGLEHHPQHNLAKKHFRYFGALFSFELKEGVDPFEVLNSLKIVVSSSNLGDNRTLAIPVAHTIFFELGLDKRRQMGIAESLIRVSTGIEDTADLLADFTQALS